MGRPLALWHVWVIDDAGVYVVACDLTRGEAEGWAEHRERADPTARYVAQRDGDPPPTVSRLGRIS